MFKKLCVDGLVHFASKNLLGTGNSECCNFVTKLFAGTLHFLCGLSLGARNDAVGFGLGAFLGIFNDRCAALFTVRDDGRRMSTCFCFDLAALGLGFGKSFVALVGSGKTLSDLVLAFLVAIRRSPRLRSL